MPFTYLSVLLYFVVPPLLLLAALHWLDVRRARCIAEPFCGVWSPWTVMGGLVLLALFYTTPWDNYLVATGVWWYDDALVTGLRIGYVPIEEYSFFVLQTLLSGLWVLFCMRRVGPGEPQSLKPRLRWMAGGVLGAIWLLGFWPLLSGWASGTYLALILVWALPPIIVQTVFGADILWHYRRLVVAGLLPAIFYLSLVDAVGILGGTWTISLEKTTGILLAGVLPLEEFTFFVATNVLIVFGMILILARVSWQRIGLVGRAGEE